MTAARRELDGVGQQVPHHLLQPPRIAAHHRLMRRERPLDADLARLAGRMHRLDRRLDDGRQIHLVDVEAQFARDDPRDVEQIVDELCLHPGVALDGGETVGKMGVDGPRSSQDHRPADDRVERRPQLVG